MVDQVKPTVADVLGEMRTSGAKEHAVEIAVVLEGLGAREGAETAVLSAASVLVGATMFLRKAKGPQGALRMLEAAADAIRADPPQAAA